ncbi:gentisate 1,2-dioxygenase [Alicyclobacillus cycloheptanicus]|uniref:Gentisate 1,2-dioxygenase n=1 Tax=Alicyclobacillus cycloheptanicus TaxID=1457 RepID=A0ABT9XMN2_9BACL|nr:gentisate 1,2-dioxygenase [Alicyclobacillus cycloheptanicus]
MTYEERLDGYYDRLKSRNLGPLWNSIGSIMTQEPKPRVIPYLWKWDEVKKFVMESGNL